MIVEVKVLFFAKAREIVGVKESVINIENTVSYSTIKETIIKEFGLEVIRNNVVIALNEEFCSEELEICLKCGDELAVIPPLSGEDIMELVASPKCGAVSNFIGMTRDNFDGKDVVKLEYEAYETMGIKAMETICLEIRSQWPDIEHIAIFHRLGVVPVKEASIVIAISSPHRTDAIKATEWCIDNVKKTVPIWKKEVYKENTSEWKQNKELENPLKCKKFTVESSQEVELTNIPSHLVQIKASGDEIDQRIKHFMERKRQEINLVNVRDFCRKDASNSDEFSCARIDSVLIKRKDSKGHLQVNKVYNNYSRDQSNLDYLLKLIPKNGVEERVSNLESQLSLTKSVPCDIYKRLKLLENRLMHLESISPEYIQFWDKTSLNSKGAKKKKIFSINEIDSIISDLESRRNKD